MCLIWKESGFGELCVYSGWYQLSLYCFQSKVQFGVLNSTCTMSELYFHNCHVFKEHFLLIHFFDLFFGYMS